MKTTPTLLICLLTFVLSVSCLKAEDIGTWDDVKKSRGSLYRTLMLSSLQDLKGRYEAKTIIRVMIAPGWGQAMAVTWIDVPVRQPHILFETNLRDHNIKADLSFVEKVEFIKPQLDTFVKQLAWKEKWNPQVSGDDLSMFMFEYYGQDEQGYVVMQEESLDPVLKENWETIISILSSWIKDWKY